MSFALFDVVAVEIVFIGNATPPIFAVSYDCRSPEKPYFRTSTYSMFWPTR